MSEGASGSSDATDVGIARAEAGDADDVLSGGEIGRYVLLRPLASGGMGIVYLAFDPELDRNVALKLVLPRRKVRSDEPDALIAEARALAKLSHPNVVQVYDVGRWRDRVYVALEYVAGRTLDAWLRSRVRPWREVLETLIDAGRGLAAAHRAGIVHLDIKPTNILIGDDGVVRVLDFGLARSAAVPTSDGSSTSSSDSIGPARVVGTVGYIAPEQFLGQVPDARSDQFGFCVTAWEALAGVRPFIGRTRHDYERALFDTPIAMPQAKQVPQQIFDVLRSGLGIRPTSRRTDMDTLLRALEAAASPWTPRRKLFAGTVLAALTVGIIAWQTADVASPCAETAQPLASTWNETRAAAIAETFAATGLPYASTAWAATRRALDDRAEAWLRTHHENCIATHVRATRPLAAHDRSNACLTARRDEIEALAGLFERADPDVVENAAAAARALRPAPACLDDGPQPEAGSGGNRELAEQLGNKLAEAWALSEASRLEAAHELAESVVAEARRAELPIVEARAQLLQGHTASRLGRVAKSLELLESGVRMADAAAADEDRITGLSDLVYVAGHLGGDRERAHWYAALALGLIKRLGGRPSQRAIVLLNEGIAYSDEGRLDDALATYRAALAAWESTGGGVDETLAVLVNNVGSVHLTRGEHEVAAGWFIQAYVLRVSLAGPEHPEVADVLVNLGNVLLRLGKPELALEHHLRALSILENARGRDDPASRFALTNTAVVLQEQGRSDEARNYAERALALWLALDADNPFVGVVISNIAEIDLGQGKAARALAGYVRAHDLLVRVLPEDHPYRANALAGIGRAQLALGDAKQAEAILRRAIDAADHADTQVEIRAEPRFALARALAELGREPAIVLGIARQARRGYAELGADGETDVAAIDAWIKTWSNDHAPR